MAWYPSNDHDSDDVEDEAGVGLIAPKAEPETSYGADRRRSWSSKWSLSVVLVLSNVAWAGICLMLWRELDTSRKSTARVDQNGFEADFGMHTPKS